MDDVCLIAAPRPLRLFPSSLHHPRARPPPPPPPPPAVPVVEAFAKFTLEESLSPPTSPHSHDHDYSPSSSEPTSAISSASEDSIVGGGSTRLSLPEETLEEFLAILRPQTQTLLPPFRFNHHHPHRRHTHNYHHHHHHSSSSSPYERPHPYNRLRKSVSTLSGSGSTEDTSTNELSLSKRSRRGVHTTTSRSGPLGRSGTMSEIDTPLTTGSGSGSDDLIMVQAEWRNFELGSPIPRNQTRNPLPRHPSYETLTANLFVSFPVSPLLRPSRNPLESTSVLQQQHQPRATVSGSEQMAFFSSDHSHS